jgi:hypothetical protein
MYLSILSIINVYTWIHKLVKDVHCTSTAWCSPFLLTLLVVFCVNAP